MADVTLSVKYADGTILRATGFINIESYNNQDNKLTVGLFPRDNTWSVFSGSGDTSGSLRYVSIAGVTYQVAADADANYQPSGYKNEAVMTGSGPTVRKQTRQERSITGIVLLVNAKEVEALRAVAEG